LEWYVRQIADGNDSIQRRQQPDRVMGITAFGEVTSHDVWYWVQDTSNTGFLSFRDAIDYEMELLHG
jgi:hypothetical protein